MPITVWIQSYTEDKGSEISQLPNSKGPSLSTATWLHSFNELCNVRYIAIQAALEW